MHIPKMLFLVPTDKNAKILSFFSLIFQEEVMPAFNCRKRCKNLIIRKKYSVIKSFNL